MPLEPAQAQQDRRNTCTMQCKCGSPDFGSYLSSSPLRVRPPQVQHGKISPGHTGFELSVMIVITIVVSRCCCGLCSAAGEVKVSSVSSDVGILGSTGQKNRFAIRSHRHHSLVLFYVNHSVPLTSAFFHPPPLSSPALRPFYLVGETRCELPHTYKPSISRLCMIVKGGVKTLAGSG